MIFIHQQMIYNHKQMAISNEGGVQLTIYIYTVDSARPGCFLLIRREERDTDGLAEMPAQSEFGYGNLSFPAASESRGKSDNA
jgi:hypothetical protein